MPLDALIDERSALRRPQLAELALEGLAPAPAYRPLTAMRVTAPVAAIQTDDGETPGAGELLFGEAFDVLETANGRAWGRARRDGRIGQANLADLAPLAGLPTHRIAALAAVVRADPHPDAPPLLTLPMNALASAADREGGFVRLDGLGWTVARAVAGIGDFEAGTADAAERFLGAPVRAGGRTGAGVDGTGLIRQSLLAVGRAALAWPEALIELGRDIGVGQARRGDLVFFVDAEGSVSAAGVMADSRRVIHASAEAGRVVAEGLDPMRRAAAIRLRRLDL